MRPHWKVNKKQIGLIHVAKAHLVASGMLTEESYRDCLAICGAGAKHANELTQGQADELLRHFQNRGWVYIPKVKKTPAIRRQARNKQIYLEAIRTGLTALGKDWAYAEAIAARMKFPRKLEWCSPEQLHKVQIALTYQERRDAGDAPVPREETIFKRQERSRRRAEAGEMPALPDFEELPF